MDQEKRVLWAQFRFGVIAPLVCRRLEESERQQLRKQILSQTFVTPDGHEKGVATRTLTEWISRYKQSGFDGLLSLQRNTLGQSRVISEPVIQRAVELRRELPTRSIKTIISILRAEQFVVSNVAKSTLNVHLNQRGASKQQLSPEKGAFQRWEQSHANALWQADTSAGIWLPNPSNPKEHKQTRLISFIDDASRVCTHAEFYWDEKLPSLVDCYRKALLKRGRPDRLLCDNAFIYHSETMKYLCAQLGTESSFCQAYSPEGKGKIEKHFGTIKAGFYKEGEHAGLTTLDELNEFFWAWLTKEYHHSIHSALKGLTPIARWCQDEKLIRRVAPEDIRRALMLRAERSVNLRTATIRLENKTYQADASFAGHKVEIRWDVNNDQRVEIWKKGQLVGEAPLTVPGRNIDFSRKPELDRKPPRGITFSSSKTYRMALLQEHDGEKPITPPRPNDYLSEIEFVSIAARLLGRSLDEQELSFLRKFFYEAAPLRVGPTEKLFGQAVHAKGTKMHLRYYCEHIRASLYKTRR